MKQNLDVSLALKDTIRFLSNSNRQWLITLLRGHLLTWRIFTIIVETTTLFYSYLCTHWVLLSHWISYSRISYTIVPLLHFACYWFIICSHCLNRGYYHIAYGICPVISYVCVCVYLVTYSTTQGRSNYPTPPISSHLHVASEAKYLPSSEHSELIRVNWFEHCGNWRNCLIRGGIERRGRRVPVYDSVSASSLVSAHPDVQR